MTISQVVSIVYELAPRYQSKDGSSTMMMFHMMIFSHSSMGYEAI